MLVLGRLKINDVARGLGDSDCVSPSMLKLAMPNKLEFDGANVESIANTNSWVLFDVAVAKSRRCKPVKVLFLITKSKKERKKER